MYFGSNCQSLSIVKTIELKILQIIYQTQN